METIINALRNTAETGSTLTPAPRSITGLATELQALPDHQLIIENVPMSAWLVQVVKELRNPDTCDILAETHGHSDHNLMVMLACGLPMAGAFAQLVQSRGDTLALYYSIAPDHIRAAMLRCRDALPACVKSDIVADDTARDGVTHIDSIKQYILPEHATHPAPPVNVSQLVTDLGEEAFDKVRLTKHFSYVGEDYGIMHNVARCCTASLVVGSGLRSALVVIEDTGSPLWNQFTGLEEYSITAEEDAGEDTAMHFEVYNKDNSVVVVDAGIKASTAIAVERSLVAGANVLLLDRAHIDLFSNSAANINARVCSSARPSVIDNAITELLRK